MAVIEVLEAWDGRGGGIDLKRNKSGFPAATRTYDRTLWVETDSAFDEAAAILADIRIPKIGDTYVGQSGVVDAFAVCMSVQPKQRSESPFHWKVDCRYSTEYLTGDVENPLLRPTRIKYGQERYSEPLMTDVVTDEYVRNAADDPFNPPPKVDRSMLVLTFTRNEAAFPLAIAQQYYDAVNSDTWNGLEPKRAKILEITGEDRPPENGFAFCEVTYRVGIKHFRVTAGWQVRLMNAGFRYWDGSKYIPARMTDGSAPREPVPLKADGRGVVAFGDQPNYVTFNGYDPLPFAILSLP